jgi:polysaccharide export outer membrane protein
MVVPTARAWAQRPAQDSALAPTQSGGGALRPGDVIHLQIWREPDLSGDFAVNETGVVVLPKVGPMRVGTLPPDSLKDRVVRAYSEYLVNPSIQVQVLRRILVLGAVKNPGVHTVDPTMTVADAIALAGGVTPEGQSDRVELQREGVRVPGHLSGRALIGNSPIQSGDQLFVPERSWLSRNPGVVIGTIGLMTTLIWRIAR